MKRLALFAEGLTEVTFLRKLIEELVHRRHLAFEVREQVGGKLQVLETPGPSTSEIKYYVLLVGCNNDERVKSEILLQRPTLIAKGYDLIIGLRDLYPETFADLPAVEAHLQYGVPQKDLPTEIMLAVAETEAWFIQEHSHFERIHPDFTPPFILATTGYNVQTQSADTISCAADFLHDVYARRGLAYRKKKNQISRTVNAIDYALLYLVTAKQLVHSKRLIDRLDAFFA